MDNSGQQSTQQQSLPPQPVAHNPIPQSQVVAHSQQQPPVVKPASAYSRFWATVIDNLIISIPAIFLAFVILALVGSPLTLKNISNLEDNALVVIAFFVFYLTYAVYLLVNKGATWGKDAYGLRVIKHNTDENITYPKAFLREVVKYGLSVVPIIGGFLYVVNGLIIIFSKEKRGLHDLLADTQVIKVKNPWSFKKQLVVFGLIVLALLSFFASIWLLYIK